MSSTESTSRTVNDYNSESALRRAMMCMDLNSEKGDETPAAFRPEPRDNLSDTDVEIDENWDWALENYDVENSECQTIREELHRLQVLKSYQILDADREVDFERLTEMGSRIFKAPICLVSLVDLGRQWFMSNRGLGDCRETPRKLAFCAHAIQNKGETFVVRDATKDYRFCNSALVTGPPFIRFYAGAPLVSPEGFKLGTFCVIDTKPRPDGCDQQDNDNLIDFAALTVKTLADRRELAKHEDPSRMIACTAHDLLTPLSGVQLSLSLLKEDQEVKKKLCDHNRELIQTASRSADIMLRICQGAIETLRETNKAGAIKGGQNGKNTLVARVGMPVEPSPWVDIQELCKSLHLIMDPIPKRVPCIISVDKSAPSKILTDDLKIFRSSLNLLSNACATTDIGSVHFRIFRKEDHLVFECEDTGRDIDQNDYDSLFKPSHGGCKEHLSDLGLYSVASQVDALGGLYGFRPRNTGIDGSPQFDSKGRRKTGSIFWFSVPIVVPSGEQSTYTNFVARSSSDSTRGIESPASFSRPANDEDTETGSRRRLPVVGGASMKGSDILAITTRSTPGKPASSSNPCFDCSRLYDEMAVSVNAQFVEGGKTKLSELKMAKMKKEVLVSTKVKSLSSVQSGSSLLKSGGGDPLKSNLSTDNKSLSLSNIPDKPVLQHADIPSECTDKRKKMALVIEDSMVVSKCLARALSKLGYEEVVQAENGAIGLEELKKTMFDIVLCDFLMPVMDGLDCVQQFRSWENEFRPSFRQYIIGISAHASKNDIEKGLKTGMDDYRPKPITMKILKAIIESPEIEQVCSVLDERYSNEDVNAIVKVQPTTLAPVVIDGAPCGKNKNKMEVDGTEMDHATKLSDFTTIDLDQKGLFRRTSLSGIPVAEGPLPDVDIIDENEDTPRKRAKLFDQIALADLSGNIEVCLIATNRTTKECSMAAQNIEKLGWKAKTVPDGEIALRLLKLRNWGAVLVDDDLPSLTGIQCVSAFREWEAKNRVNRQNNIFLVCTDGIDLPVDDACSVVQAPVGFDGVLTNPISLDHFKILVSKTKSLKRLHDNGLAIVTR